MLATERAHELVRGSKAERALAGTLLPANNNPSVLELENVHSITVVEGEEGKARPVALGVFHNYTPNQSYCSVLACSRAYDGLFVTGLEQVKCKPARLGLGEEAQADAHHLYKVRGVLRQLPDLSSFPQYFTAFAAPAGKPLLQAVVDELIERAFGHQNFDIKRNITVDLYDSQSGQPEQSDHLWRDESGFVVGDRNRFAELELSRLDALAVLERAPLAADLTLLPLEARTAELFVDYDSSITVIDRQPYLEYLFRLQGVRGCVALDAARQPVGYVLGLADRVLQLYAESEQVANTLLLQHLRSSAEESVKFFAVAHEQSAFKALAQRARVQRRVRRFHTRILPANVKWGHVYLLNMGAHLY